MNPSRRQFVGGAALAAGGLALRPGRSAPAPAKTDTPFKHSVMGWCFRGRGVEPKRLAQWCVKLGMHGIEGIPRTAYKEVMDLGLEISLVGSHSFARGPCDPKHTDMVVEKLKDGCPGDAVPWGHLGCRSGWS